MPKMKTKSSAKKRFWVSGSGKIMRKKQGLRHNLGSKSTSRKKSLGMPTAVHSGNLLRIRKQLLMA